MTTSLQRDRAACGLLLTASILVASTTDGTPRVVAMVAAGIVLLTIGIREARARNG